MTLGLCDRFGTMRPPKRTLTKDGSKRAVLTRVLNALLRIDPAAARKALSNEPPHGSPERATRSHKRRDQVSTAG